LFTPLGAVTVTAAVALLAATVVLQFIGTGSSRNVRTMICQGGACDIPQSSPLPFLPSPASSSPRPRDTHLVRARTRPPARSNGAAQSATPMPSPSPSAIPIISVSYRIDRFGFGYGYEYGGFKGELSLTNSGTAPAARWQLVIELPGDRIYSVTNANASGDALVLSPSPDDAAIQPGSTLTIVFTAQGPTYSPTGCTFDGTACR
jgi:hypothetical protein